MVQIRFMSVFIGVLLALVAPVALVGCSGADSDSAPPYGAPPLTLSFLESPTGFTFDYPEGWRYSIPAQNLLILDPVGGEGPVKPAMTVQRSLLLTAESSLEASMQEYLRVGPMRVGTWEVIEEVSAVRLDERPALRVRLQGSNDEDSPQTRTDIYMTEADSGMVYVFVLAATVAQWEQFAPTLEAVLNTVHILE